MYQLFPFCIKQILKQFNVHFKQQWIIESYSQKDSSAVQSNILKIFRTKKNRP